MISVCIKLPLFLIGPKRLLWSPHIRASGQTGKLHPHKLDRTRRERVLHHLPGLISPHRSLVWGVDGALRVKGRGGGYIPHHISGLISSHQLNTSCVKSTSQCCFMRKLLNFSNLTGFRIICSNHCQYIHCMYTDGLFHIFFIYRGGNILSQSEQTVLYKFIQAITALFFPFKLYQFIIYNKCT